MVLWGLRETEGFRWQRTVFQSNAAVNFRGSGAVVFRCVIRVARSVHRYDEIHELHSVNQ